MMRMTLDKCSLEKRRIHTFKIGTRINIDSTSKFLDQRAKKHASILGIYLQILCVVRYLMRHYDPAKQILNIDYW